MTPVRPTTSGLLTPKGAPVRYGPSPVTQQYSHGRDLSLPSAQWGDRDLEEEEEEKKNELFGRCLSAQRRIGRRSHRTRSFMESQDKLESATILVAASSPDNSNSNFVRCIGGRIVRPQPPRDDSPSTACNSSTISISTPGGVRLGAAEPRCFGQPLSGPDGSRHSSDQHPKDVNTENSNYYLIFVRGFLSS